MNYASMYTKHIRVGLWVGGQMGVALRGEEYTVKAKQSSRGLIKTVWVYKEYL